MITITEAISGNILADCSTIDAGRIIGERYRELLELAYRATFGAVELNLTLDLGVSGSVPGPVVDRDGEPASDATMDLVREAAGRAWDVLSAELETGLPGLVWDDGWSMEEEVTRQARL